MTEKVKEKRKYLLFFFLVLFLIVISGVFFYHKTNGQVETLENKAPILASTAMEESLHATEITFSGEVKPNRLSKIKLDESLGAVGEVRVQKGDIVEAGQVLFVYTNQETSLQYDESLLETQTKEAELALAKKNSENSWSIYYSKVSALSEAKAEQAEEDLKLLQNEVNAANQEALQTDSLVRTAEIALERAQGMQQGVEKKLEQNEIKAEIPGVITELNQELLEQGSSEWSEGNFIEITDKSSLKVVGDISEFDIENVLLEQSVMAISRKDPQLTWPGKISKLANEANVGEEKTDEEDMEKANVSQYSYQVSLENTENMPLTGSHVYLKTLSPIPKAGELWLSHDYIFSEDEKFYIWLVQDNLVKKHEVEIEIKERNLVHITAGLAPTDRILFPADDLVDDLELNEND